MADFFEHYPTPVDEIVGIAAQLFRQARDPKDRVKDVSDGVRRATDAVDGDIGFPMERSDHQVVALGTNVAEGARFVSACVMVFAEAVHIYDKGIDRLNAQIRDSEAGLDPGGQVSKLTALNAERARLEAALDDEARRVAGMLERGPNETDWAFLRQHHFALDDPTLLAPLGWMPKGNPEEMRKWWAGLSPAQRAAIMATHPEWLGNTDGLPAAVRDEANRIMLRENYETLKAKQQSGEPMNPIEKRALANIEKVIEQLQKREGHVDPLTGEPVPVQLYIYQPYAYNGDGRVAIAVGDLDEADHVAVNVRGATNVQGLTHTRPLNMYDESRWAGDGSSVAVMDYMGYDAPNASVPDHPYADFDGNSVGGALPWMADAGADQLAADVAGLRASRSDDPAHLTVIGHSYGSTTAADENGLDADDLVLIGVLAFRPMTPVTSRPGTTTPGSAAGAGTPSPASRWR